LLVGVTLITSCKKEDVLPVPNTPSQKPVSSDAQTKIGKKLPNPFTVENMENAYNELSRQKTDTELESNQLYVRFFPETTEESKYLEEQGLILWDIPLDVEVEQYGSTYHDPASPNTTMTWLYTTVKPDYEFGNIKHEIIDSLFLPNLENGEEKRTKSLFNEFSSDDLVSKSLELLGYENDEETGPKRASAKYTPKGYIKVQQNINGSVTNIGVKRVKVRSRWWFDIGTGYTDDNGYFSCNETYRKNRDVNIIIIFENEYVDIRGIKGLNFLDIFFTERKNIGEFENGSLENINYTFNNSTDLNSSNKRYWMACHSLNAIREHHVYCTQTGIPTPPKNLNMWLTNAGKNGNSLSTDAAAPLLKQMGNSSMIMDVTKLFLVNSGHPWLAVSLQVLLQYPPDITYNYSGGSAAANLNSDKIAQTLFHELSHASHYSKVGNSFWTPYIAYIVQHGGYGDATKNGSGRIAISEAWAEFCGARFAHLRYGENNSIGGINNTWMDYIEKFNPNSGSFGWMPEGVFHDLTDVGEPTTTNVTDNVSGYSISQCFGSMDVDIVSVSGYKSRFISEYGSAQQSNINNLFKSYGY
jgi:hypothetical protein